MQNVAQSPFDRAVYEVRTDETDIAVSYDPAQKNASGGHISYKTVYSLNENPLYSSLFEKANQLRGTGFSGPLGIFVCDGGCEFLTSTISRDFSYEPKDVIHEFLREERLNEQLAIQFVVTFSVVYSNPLDLRSARIEIQHYRIPARYETPVDMMPILEQLTHCLPVPERNAANAVDLLKEINPYYGASFRGGLRMNKNIVKLSSRSLLALLSGAVSQAEFFRAHGFVESEDEHYVVNVFQRALKNGRLIKNVSIESGGSADDDWVIFEFGEPDPAVVPFRVPATTRPKTQ